MSIALQLGSAPLEQPVVRLVLATALGLFLGLEREWSEKAAGVRTFALISLLAATLVTLEQPVLLALGGVLVFAQGAVLSVRGLLDPEAGLSLTTWVAMFVAYGVGALVAAELVVEGVAVAVITSLLLLEKHELHSIAGGLTRPELRSASEFAILAFVIYPLLPQGSVELVVRSVTVTLEPRVAWMMVVTVAAIGIGNYVIVTTYGGRGVAMTGFFGGLASSTAVVGSMIDYVQQESDARGYAVAAILLAVAAMALRNLAIVLAFTINQGLLLDVAVPLLAIVAVAGGLAVRSADWSEPVEFDLESPFAVRNVVGFGAVFAIVLVAGSAAEQELGQIGFYAATAATGFVSSGGATTSAVILYRSGTIGPATATVGVLLATAASIVVKALLTGVGGDRAFARAVSIRSALLLAVATEATLIVVL
ncbi:MgtC/SapB family protein [Salinarchaeum laminariae]|uniref:MgtC/SapB family protein n=1 Tax=Salinarchaeum laminariae TaxID=869888 RepID=UPI0020BF0AC2|nr:MgtC/SapB family protein [Salinarchaeum laminariae]